MSPAAPVFRPLSRADLSAALADGWRDFRRAPAFGLFFAGFYVAGGLFLVWAMTTTGQIWWTIPLTLGFPLLGPFVAVGFYEVSRRLEAGEAPRWRAVLGVIAAERNRQIPTMAAVIVVFFLFWNFVAHMIFALFMGLQVMTNPTSSFTVWLTPNGIGMIVLGTAVGAGFATVLYALSVLSLPMLLDREVDFVTAMLASLACVSANPALMLGWGALIAAVVFVGMIPAFAGLFVALPLFGLASWHLYRPACG
ncbi:MAG: DUF2189 domain-containing protein [Alphaproteobacteria bacterium]|nr:DUF2189 domain-containing protein [Alphaproteobacteria bacterium]